MMMKRVIQTGMLLLGLLLLPLSGEAGPGKLTSSSFTGQVVYYGIPKGGLVTMQYNITVATPQGVSYGVYKSKGTSGQTKGSQIPLVSWTGTGTAPTLTFSNYDKNITRSLCPGLASDWVCASSTLTVTVQSDNYGCPWVSSIYMTSESLTQTSDTMSYVGPVTRGTICPTVPVDTYDISWDPNVVKHDTVLSVASTGGTVTSKLQTYLMESGSLCDKSRYDTRGAYCRFIGTGITLSVQGCDNSNVTTTASAYALTDKPLHDINVSVDTKKIGSGTVKATCSFQYVLNQL